MRLRTFLATSAIALAALVQTGCERAVFAVANRGLPAPEATVQFAPELGLSLDVYRAQNSGASAPVVVFFYGGNWQRGSRDEYRFVGRRLAQNGVLTIVADYRKFPAVGYPGFVQDGARAVAWAQVHARDYGGDPRRLFVAGHSAGAQIAALIGADARYLKPHGMAPRDLAGTIALSGPNDFVINGQYVPIFGASAQWPSAQPVNAVDGDEPPFLLVHGDADTVVGTFQSRRMADRLRAAHVPVTLVLLPGGGHTAPMQALYDPAREPLTLPAILDFIRAPAGSPTR